jgi:MurNAc alpha-1-phosphate uridylyltransferase
VIDALIFAAGLGTRLRPVTDSIPKALVEVGGTSVLERAIRRVRELRPGIIVVNAHHHAELVEAAVDRLNRSFEEEAGRAGVPMWPRIVVSLEVERPLETGGGLRKAAPLFGPGHSVLLHNADVVTDLDLLALVAAHDAGARDVTSEGVGRSAPLATLAVQDRASSRKLLFDPEGLFGRLHVGSGREEVVRPARGPRREWAFSGVQVVSPELISCLPDDEVFSITDQYLALAAAGKRIEAHDIGATAWWDIGTPERLAAARGGASVERGAE